MVLIAYSMINKKKIKIDILSNLKPIKFINVNEISNKYNLDYILVILFLGNDYLPKLSNIDYDEIINCYNNYIKHKNSNIIEGNNINYDNLVNFITYIIVNKNIKFNIKKIQSERFEIYYNNILWCLKKYKVIENNKSYIEDTNNVINIYNFINHKK
jgi:5'-3' exonuclease